MGDNVNIPLVSTEISGIWNTYMGETLLACVLKYFSNRVDDNETQTVLQHALENSNNHIAELTNIFSQENLPVPEGFNDSDVNINAPRLFTDTFYLQYIGYASKTAMNSYSLFLNRAARVDIRNFFSKSLKDIIDLYNWSTEIMLSKGVFIKSPRVEVPKNVQYTESENFISDLFGKKKALLVDEISHAFSITNDTSIRKTLITGFGQVCKDKKVSNYIAKVLTLSAKQNSELITTLREDDIPVTDFSDSYITDSTISPFSDKLMLNKILLMYKVKINNYGMCLANSMRIDLITTYMKQLDEAIKCAEDGVDILIHKRWLEQPPQAISSKNLARV